MAGCVVAGCICASRHFNAYAGTQDANHELLLRMEETDARLLRSMDRFVQQAKLMPADGTVDDECGHAVALSGDGNTALVGAPYADLSGSTNQGAAYVFTRSGNSWIQQKKLMADDCAANDLFGSAVALSSDGNTALVGAPWATLNEKMYQGAVYMFTRAGGAWSQPAKLAADDGDAGHLFGRAVALSDDGNTALIGANWGLTTNYGAGGYVFTRSGGAWSQQEKLMAADGAVNNGFGVTVALSGDGNTALVGAMAAYWGVIPGVGAAYVFTRALNIWSQQEKLTADDGTQGAYFGSAAALSGNGNTALIGASAAIVGRNMQGAGYVFTRAGGAWSQQEKLAAADGAEWDDFGYAAALSSDGNTALISAMDADTGGHADQGAAYVFTRAGGAWSQREKLTADDGAEYDDFGESVALSGDGNTALIGAYYPKSLSWKQKKGAGYVFASANQAIAGPVIKANGSTNNIAVNYPDPVSVTVSMVAGDYTGLADWWAIIVPASGNWWYLNSAMQWTPFTPGDLAACRPAYQGLVMDVTDFTVLNQYPLPVGTYDFYFGLDEGDGILNYPDMLIDTVRATVHSGVTLI